MLTQSLRQGRVATQRQLLNSKYFLLDWLPYQGLKNPFLPLTGEKSKKYIGSFSKMKSNKTASFTTGTQVNEMIS